jgi:hypothetical protein
MSCRLHDNAPAPAGDTADYHYQTDNADHA